MAKFIALHRQSRTQTMGMAAMSFENRRSRIVQEAAFSERSETLQSIGLEESTAEKPVPELQSSFQRLGYVGAYIVDSPTEDMSEQAKEVLEDDYMIMPDIELALPRPTLSQRFSRRPRREPYWPAESGVSTAHDNGITGERVLVGVLDTGCDADHIELRKKQIEFRYVPLKPSTEPMRSCRGFDVNGHGTHVCGIIAGKNVGVAPGVDLMVASVIESETLKTSVERIFVALDWMLSQFQLEENLTKPIIINMSLGFRPEWISGPSFQSVMDGMKLLLSTIVVDFGGLAIVAIGNDGAGTMRAPGYFPETLSVGAVDFAGKPAFFSGGGQSPLTGDPEPNVVGYGVDVLSSLERDMDNRSLYANMDGTSMSTPYVVGIAALLASAYSGLKGNALRQRLIDEIMPLDASPNRVGAGLAKFA